MMRPRNNGPRRTTRSGLLALCMVLLSAVLAPPVAGPAAGVVLGMAAAFAIDPAGSAPRAAEQAETGTRRTGVRRPPADTTATPPGTDTWVTDHLLVGLRAGPDDGQEVLGIVGSGAELRAIGRKGEWVQVEGEQGAGWVHSAYLTTTPPAAQRALALEQRLQTLEADLHAVRGRAQVLAVRERNRQGSAQAPMLVAGLLVGLALFLCGAAAAASWIGLRRR